MVGLVTDPHQTRMANVPEFESWSRKRDYSGTPLKLLKEIALQPQRCSSLLFVLSTGDGRKHRLMRIVLLLASCLQLISWGCKVDGGRKNQKDLTTRNYGGFDFGGSNHPVDFTGRTRCTVCLYRNEQSKAVPKLSNKERVIQVTGEYFYYILKTSTGTLHCVLRLSSSTSLGSEQ